MTDLLTENARLRAALEAAIAWIDAVPKGTDLPVMPGFDRDDVDELLAASAPDAVQEAARVAEIAALIEAADNLMLNYLQDELCEPDLCVDDEHWAAIHDFNAALRAIAGDRT